MGGTAVPLGGESTYDISIGAYLEEAIVDETGRLVPMRANGFSGRAGNAACTGYSLCIRSNTLIYLTRAAVQFNTVDT